MIHLCSFILIHDKERFKIYYFQLVINRTNDNDYFAELFLQYVAN